MKQTVTLFVHANLDYSAKTDWMSEFVFSTGDMSDMKHCNYAVIKTVEIEVEFDRIDTRALAIAKIDAQIESVKAAKVYEVAKLENMKAELLAIGQEVAA